MKVKFLPIQEEHEIQSDQSVMNLAHQKGIKIKTICNGQSECGECLINLVEGEENVLPPTMKEQSVVGTGYFLDNRRLSCQLKCFGDITVDLDPQRRSKGSDTESNDTESFLESNIKEDE